MAAVVYEGVGGGGELFAGSKYYILQRVPTRSRWVELIEQNGGEIVALDKYADYVIADHARKDNPPGSISWKWVEQSVKKGELQDVDEYPAGPAEGTVRSAGSTVPPKSTRTPFTTADDKFLSDWVMAAQRKGAPIKGNEVYIQLALKNPRHTYQSWRDRWVKHVSHQAHTALPDEEEEADDDVGYVPPSRARTASRIASNSTKKVAAGSSATTAKPSIRIRPPPTIKNDTEPKDMAEPVVEALKPVNLSTGNRFTDEEDELLLEASKPILNLDSRQELDAWCNWALEYPTHSAQEWRNRFEDHIKPQLATEDAEEEDDEDQEIESIRKPQSTPQRHVEEVPTKRQLFHQFSSKNRPSSSHAHSRALETRDSQDLSKKKLELQDTAEDYVDPTTVDEILFTEQLKKMADILGLEVDFEPLIGGRHLPLFTLWQVVRSEKFGGYDNVQGLKQWPQVAKALNYNPFLHTRAAHELQACYSEILADFETSREQFLQPHVYSPEPEDQAQHTPIRPVIDLEQSEEDDEDLFVTPLQYSSSTKRRVDVGRTPLASSINKKPRLDKGKGRALESPTPEKFTPRIKKKLLTNQGKGMASESPSPEKVKEVPSTPDEVINGTAYPTNSHRPSSPANDSSSESASLSQKFADMETFKERMMALGYEEEDFDTAFLATCMREGNIAVILESMREGHGIPRNIRGVWTESDDENLEADSQSREFSRVCRKHGKQGVEERRDFLRKMDLE
ncbi:ARID-like protein [Glarea lozoyensis ATCC 20868]|uniref:DNA-binding protein RAP1 n=1 Tax=Glarea lozoyensis (strain ATCC 20868 / MF5171) TaxID=1116229 RepID=S3CZZ9_GLAL2|nr:ARID-like protein [Glarea lozoyensis ATCC 20868]EPE25386.1 ARID-like protein [Glarea lozoyensis ATCC 20868]